MREIICYLFGCKGVGRRSTTEFLDWDTRKYVATVNTWMECKRCGKRLTTGVTRDTGEGQGMSDETTRDRNQGSPLSRYRIGDRVEKTGGDYTFAGHVVALVYKRSGHLRYVVEDDRGLLFIFKDEQLAAYVGGA